MVLPSWPRPLRGFTHVIWWIQTEHLAVVNPHSKPTELSYESTDKGCYHSHLSSKPPKARPFAERSRHRLLLLFLNQYANGHFTVPRRVDGWVDLGIAGKCRAHAQGSGCRGMFAVRFKTGVFSHRGEAFYHCSTSTLPAFVVIALKFSYYLTNSVLCRPVCFKSRP